MVPNSVIKKFQKLVYKGSVKSEMSLAQFQDLCLQIDDLEKFVNSPVFPFVTFDGVMGFDAEYNEEDEGRRLFFHFGWMNKNLKQVKPLSLVIYLDDAEDYSSGSGEFFYDFYDDEWDVIFKYLVNDLRAE